MKYKFDKSYNTFWVYLGLRYIKSHFKQKVTCLVKASKSLFIYFTL